jgi:hypothetical protein
MLLMLSEYIAHSQDVRYLDKHWNIFKPKVEMTVEIEKAMMMYDQYLAELVSYTIEKLMNTVQIRIRRSRQPDWWYPQKVKGTAVKK